MKITKKQIKDLNPCAEGYKWYLKNGSEDLLETLLKVNETNPGWARWLYSRLMALAQKRAFAIHAAEQVLPIFETKYPKDKRPRKAIEAAKAVLVDDTSTSRRAAADAASAASAAAYAAVSASAAASAAAASVAYATSASATAAAGMGEEMRITLINKAVEILERGLRT